MAVKPAPPKTIKVVVTHPQYQRLEAVAQQEQVPIDELVHGLLAPVTNAVPGDAVRWVGIEGPDYAVLSEAIAERLAGGDQGDDGHQERLELETFIASGIDGMRRTKAEYGRY